MYENLSIFCFYNPCAIAIFYPTCIFKNLSKRIVIYMGSRLISHYTYTPVPKYSYRVTDKISFTPIKYRMGSGAIHMMQLKKRGSEKYFPFIFFDYPMFFNKREYIFHKFDKIPVSFCFYQGNESVTTSIRQKTSLDSYFFY